MWRPRVAWASLVAWALSVALVVTVAPKAELARMLRTERRALKTPSPKDFRAVVAQCFLRWAAGSQEAWASQGVALEAAWALLALYSVASLVAVLEVALVSRLAREGLGQPGQSRLA